MKALPEAPGLTRYRRPEQVRNSLRVTVQSFSYKTSGVPLDLSGNGGGFVFDCRSLHNPGRYQPYKQQTGRDQPVIDFLHEKSRIVEFMADVISTVEPEVKRYLERDFRHLK